MYLCLFTIEIYEYMHSLHTFLAHAAHGVIDIVMEDSEGRRQQQAGE